MIRRLRQRYQTKVDFEALLTAVTAIRAQHAVLDVCVKPTGYSWLGVRTAAYSLFPHNTVEIPQYYSQQLLTDKQLTQLGEHIGRLQFHTLVYSGYNAYFSQISAAALRVHPALRIAWIHHGFPAELSGNPVMANIFGRAIHDYKNGHIHKVGLIKKNWELLFGPLYGIPAQHLLNKVPISNPVPPPQQLRIGVLLNDGFRKNQITQVMAAAAIPQATVVINHENGVKALLPYTDFDIVGSLDHAAFLRVLGGCTVNSHITFSEASGGNVLAESLAMGVPCLSGLTHGWLDENPTLLEALTVTRADDAWAIRQKMMEVIERRAELSPLCVTHAQKMNDKADKLLATFLAP